jgi:hypothetical protein
MQSTTEMVLTLLAILVGFCRDCLVASGEIVFDNEIVKPFMQ